MLTPHSGASSAASVAQLREAMCATTLEWFGTGWAEAVVNPDVVNGGGRIPFRPGPPRAD